MLQEFQNVFSFSVSLLDVISNMGAALICGLLILFFYRITYRGAGYSVSYLNSLVVLSMITALVIMVIGNNLARAFGLVGAMSIIRFRTAVKETMDIIYIFFALAIGMAAGVGLHILAIMGTIIIGVVLVILTKTNLIASTRDEYLLQFYYVENGNSTSEADYIQIISRFCRHYKLINVKSTGNGNGIELSYYIKLKNKNENAELVKQLKSVSGLNHVNLFFDEEHY